MKLGNIMVKRVITISSKDNIMNAARKMREGNIGCLVVSEGRKVEGIITDRDLVVSCLGAGHISQLCQVLQHMSSPVITAEPTMDIWEANRLMTHKGIKRLPVVKEGDLIGIVSFSDIAQALDKPMHDLLFGVGAARHSKERESSLIF
ncbi:MAG: protein YhcV [Dehalococcoidia bacterium]|nr:protein YhcV [Dehalococcoidia bacterium]